MDATPITLFNTPEAVAILQSAATLLRARQDLLGAGQLSEILHIVASNAESFDRNCQLNLEWVGRQTLNRIQSLSSSAQKEDVDFISAAMFRFMIEYDMSIKNELSMEILSFIGNVYDKRAGFSPEAQRMVEFARQEMSVGIIKKIINTEDFGSLRNLSKISTTVNQKITGWESKLDETEKKATQLGEVLEKQTQAFNFVGLHDGFLDLSTEIKRELMIAHIGIGLFGLLVLLPSSIDLSLIFMGIVDFSKQNVQTLIAMVVAIVAITLLFLYFFRIALRKADSCRAQLIQVRLRMTLCRFIQSYADYSSEIKAKNGEALTKFENLIFAGIVGSDDKLPSTFDGIEQLATFAKSITGKS
jgi:biopolymer transport protein ExbB/TolQ